jgi:hypothetical protein
MNVTTGKYESRLSSGTLATILLVSAIATPILLAFPIMQTVKAATSQFTASMSYPYVVVGTSGATRALTISNPAGNPGIVEVDVSIPAAAAQAVSSGAFVAGFVNSGTPAVAGVGPWTIVYSGSPSGAVILPQGAAGTLSFTFNAEASETVPGVADSYPLTITVTYKDGSTQTTTVNLYEGSATMVQASVTGITFTAGSNVKVTVTTSPAPDQNIPLVFFSNPSIATIMSNGFTASFTPSSGTTDATGTAVTLFNSTWATGPYFVKADAGKPSTSDTGGLLSSSISNGFQLTAGPPTKVAVHTSADIAGMGVTYVGSDGTSPLTYPTVSVSLADKFGNPVTGASGTISFTSLQGQLTAAAACGTSPYTYPLPPPCTITYSPTTSSGKLLTFGTPDLITASLTVTSPSNLAGQYIGSSKQISVGYLGTTPVSSITPSVFLYTPSPSNNNNPAAGSTVNLAFSIGAAQAGVPLNFTLTSTSSTPYTGTFANGMSWIVVTTNANGQASVNFTADTVAGHAATAKVLVSTPTSTSPSKTSASASTAPITTSPGAPQKLKLVTSSTPFQPPPGPTPTSYVKPGGKLFVNVILQDAYGNSVSNSFNFALQVTLSATAGGFSSTTVYITTGHYDTQGSGYTVQYTAPTTLGDVTLSASTTQPGIGAGSKTVHVVSPNPLVFITSPTSGTTTSSSATVSGYAIPSPAAASGTLVVTIKYSLNGAANVTVPITGTNASGASFFSFSVSLTSGNNTVKVYATDTNGNTGSATKTIAMVPPVSFANSVQLVGTPKYTTIGGFNGIAANFTNMWSTSLNLVVFAVWKNSAGQTVAVTTGGLTLASGATAQAFAPLTSPLPSGTYTVNIFVVTTSNQPVSTTTTVTITV